MDPGRHKRREEIEKSLTFIQSSLAYPEPEGYQDFLTRLVCNLLEEGNASFRDGDWAQAVREFSEGLNVSCYAEAEQIQIPEALLESLYVNRAAAYHSMGEYEQGVTDCDTALKVCPESCRALYRKALCLKELGKHREAYNCTTDCLLITRLDKQVNELAQELAVQLGLKKRKPYVCAKEGRFITSGATNGNRTSEAIKVSAASVGNGTNPLKGLAAAPSCHQLAVSSVPDIDDSELMGDDLDSLLDCFPAELETSTHAAFSIPSRAASSAHTFPSVLPAPTPQLPPAFFSSAISELNSLDSFSGHGLNTAAVTLDTLDDLLTSGIGGVAGTTNFALSSEGLDTLDGLDSLDDFSNTSSAAAGNESKPDLVLGVKSLDDLESVSNPGASSGDEPKVGVKAVNLLDSLDALDSFPSAEDVGLTGLDMLSDFSSSGISGSQAAAPPVMRSPKNNYKEKKNHALVSVSNPLSSTHEFLQACTACFPRRGKGIYTFVHKPNLVHTCDRDTLLCRRKSDCPVEWTRVRPIPNNSNTHTRPFTLCRELLNSGHLGVCKYGENCTFAYNQLEIDVWTQERKGTLDRTLLFETGFKMDPVSSVIHLLQENKGMFIFLCQECYDNKPRIISKRSRDNHTICSNLDVLHNFDTNKCLAFVVKTHNVNYRKVRPLSVLSHLDLCRQAIRYGCQREDSCYNAHSVIELKTWKVQRDTGISPDEIVNISTKYYDTQNSSKQKGNKVSGSKSKGGAGGVGKSLNMNMKFACALCWRDGLISEPDKALKHCNAKARHTWAKERWVLLVKSIERNKWVPVRSLPHAKNFPLQYDICTQILEKKRCNYSGKCTFAHSQEEKEMWMYMKNNNLREMQQMYDMWLSLTQNRQSDGAVHAQPVPEEKNITMPTDYAEQMSGLHCRLCGRHSNSERQWQQHISTEKHKDRVFSCEGEEEALTWNYRFPGLRFELCPKFDGGCPDGVSCDYAHSSEELQEWTERRDFLRQKLAKARDDMLIMPDDFDFGKFNFLLQD